MKQLIKNTLRENRRRIGLRQIDVAHTLGFMSAERISEWEKGLSYPHLTNLAKLTRLYGIKAENLYPVLFQYISEK